MTRPRLLFVVNADWFFLSHRLALGRASREAGFDVTVCAGDSGAGGDIERLGMRFVPFKIQRGGTRPTEELVTVGDLARTYASVRPDIVHHVTIKPVIYGSLVARSLRIRGIVNAVSGLGYAFIPRAQDGLRHRLLRRGLWGAYRLALDSPKTRVIFQNGDDRRAFVDRGLVAEHRARLIRGSGVDFSLFSKRPLPTGPFVALLPARLLRDKGVLEFVEAATRLKVLHPSVRFALLGRLDPGNPAAIGRGEVERWVQSGVIEWWGQAEHAHVPDLLARAHVVVLPSYREGLSLALAEAAALGRACITTDVPGCRDVVEEGQTGWIVPPRDAGALARALEHAIESPGEVRRRGEAAATLARERFGVDAVVRDTLGIYRELLGSAATAF